MKATRGFGAQLLFFMLIIIILLFLARLCWAAASLRSLRTIATRCGSLLSYRIFFETGAYFFIYGSGTFYIIVQYQISCAGDARRARFVAALLCVIGCVKKKNIFNKMCKIYKNFAMF